MEERSIDDILTGQQPDEATQSAQTPEAGQEAEPGKSPETTQAKEPDGQHEAGEAEKEQGADKATETPEDSDPKAWQYAAYKDEKTKRQELEGRISDAEKRAQEAERRAQEFQRQLFAAQQPKPEPIDPDLDPEGYQRQQQESWQQTLNQRMVAQSRAFANRLYGKEVVDGAYAWACDNLPEHEANAVAASADPFGECVERKKKADALAEIGDDPVAYRERVKAELLAEQEQKPAQQTPATPMPSNLAGGRNSGSRSGPAWSGPPSIDDIFANR